MSEITDSEVDVDILKSDLTPTKMWEMFKENIKIEDRKYHLKTYSKCFIGPEAVIE